MTELLKIIAKYVYCLYIAFSCNLTFYSHFAHFVFPFKPLGTVLFSCSYQNIHDCLGLSFIVIF